MRTMNTCFAVGAISLFLASTTTVVQAQVQLVRLSVMKVQKYNKKGDSTMAVRGDPASAHYTISIQNAGNKPLKSLRVEWKTLAQTPDKKYTAPQGEKTVDVEIGKTYEFDTDSADGKALGYSVQVFSEDKVIASATEPPDIKAQIEKATASGAKSP